MPAFGNYGKSGKPVPTCLYHNKSLATCTCKYARAWRETKTTVTWENPELHVSESGESALA